MPTACSQGGAANTATPALNASSRMQDGGRAAQRQMRPSTQSVDSVRRVVTDAQKKGGIGQPVQNGSDFNEEDYMDGAMLCSCLLRSIIYRKYKAVSRMPALGNSCLVRLMGFLSREGHSERYSPLL